MLATARLTLRPPEPRDLAPLFAIYGDPATHAFNPAGPLTSIEQAALLLERWMTSWQQYGFGPWTISRREDDEVIGFGGISLYRYLDQERINMGYRFAASAWGQGYATELARAALAFGFHELGFDRIFALVRPLHGASIRVLEKAGMHPFGLLDDVPGAAPSLVYVIERGLI